MFWGLILEPQRRYSQVVKRSFHISKASLDIFAATDKPCQVMLTSQDRNYLLCTLQKDAKLQCNLDLNFVEGEEVMFATNGGSNIHLTGYLIEDELESGGEEEEDGATTEEEFEEVAGGNKRKKQFNDNQAKKKTKTELLLDEIDNDYNSEDDPTYPNIDDDVESEEFEEVDEEEDDDEDDSDESGDDISNLSKEDVFANGGSGKRQLRKAVQNLLNKSNEDSESEEEERPSKQKFQSKVNGISKNKNEKSIKGDKSAKQQKVAKESPKSEKLSNNKSQETKSPKKTRQIEGGVTIQDLKEGDGKLVKNGKVVQVYYEGRLKSNNKLFDSASKGAGFKFRVGKKEVIKGWDVGLVGMKVGGKRRIICPPNMAYGTQGSGSVIPPNSTLVFDIEVKNVS